MNAPRKIVITTDSDAGLDAPISGHFGRCPFFTFVTLSEDGEVGEVEVVPNPAAANHQPGQIPQFVRSRGAEVVLAGGMGRRAITLFEHFEVEVASGASGRAGDALSGWLEGTLKGAAGCAQSEQHHEEGHHHGGGHHHH